MLSAILLLSTLALAEDDCVAVNHVYDNPGHLTCDCVPKDDPCISDKQCVPEDQCKDYDPEEEECVPYSIQACRNSIRNLGLKAGSRINSDDKFAANYAVEGCHVYATGDYAGKVFYGRDFDGDLSPMKGEIEPDNLGVMYRPRGYDCNFKGKDNTKARKRCPSLSKRQCFRSDCCTWSTKWGDSWCQEVNTYTCGAIEAWKPVKDSCSMNLPRIDCLINSGCVWDRSTLACTEAPEGWQDKCTSYNTRQTCTDNGCKWRPRDEECEIPQ